MTFRIVDKNWHGIFEDLSSVAQERALIISPFLGGKVSGVTKHLEVQSSYVHKA